MMYINLLISFNLFQFDTIGDFFASKGSRKLLFFYQEGQVNLIFQ